MSRDWSLYLEDIRDACDLIATFTKGLGPDEFRATPLVFHAVVRNLEIIGEAAKRLPEEARTRMPEIDWSGAAKFRDVIAHQYFGIDPDIVWDVVRTRIAPMRAAAERELKARDVTGE